MTQQLFAERSLSRASERVLGTVGLCAWAWLAGCGKAPPVPATQADQQPAPAVAQQGMAQPGIEQARPAEVENAQHAAAKNRAGELLGILCQPATTPADWETAQTELATLGAPAAAVLAEAAGGTDPLRREMAISMLALMGSEAEVATPALLVALRDPSPFVRANAAATLVQFPAHSAVTAPVLIELLDSSEPSLRQMAATNLSVMDTAATAYIPRLATTLAKESAPEVLLPVVHLLGRMGPAAKPALPQLQNLAHQAGGEVGVAANQAIQLIAAEAPADAGP